MPARTGLHHAMCGRSAPAPNRVRSGSGDDRRRAERSRLPGEGRSVKSDRAAKPVEYGRVATARLPVKCRGEPPDNARAELLDRRLGRLVQRASFCRHGGSAGRPAGGGWALTGYIQSSTRAIARGGEESCLASRAASPSSPRPPPAPPAGTSTKWPLALTSPSLGLFHRP